MSWIDRMGRFMLGNRYKPVPMEEHRKFREAIHEGRNVAAIASASIRRATKSSERAMETAQQVIERLEKRNDGKAD